MLKRLLTLAAFALTTQAQAIVLDFGSGPSAPTICSAVSDGSGPATLCTNFGTINQAYGDSVGLDVTYLEDPGPNSLAWWAEDYNDLYGVLFANAGGAHIDLLPTNGGVVTLTHLDLGAFSRNTLNTTLNIYALSDTSSALYTRTGPVGSGNDHTSFNSASFNDFDNLSSPSGLRIEWSGEAYNVGIDNITFSVTAVPEPGSLALMLTGLGALGFAAKRRRMS